jgi:hypothetical protein
MTSDGAFVVSGPEAYNRKRKTLTQACVRCHERKIKCIAGECDTGILLSL